MPIKIISVIIKNKSEELTYNMMELAKLNISDTNVQKQNNKDDNSEFEHDIFLTPSEILITKPLTIMQHTKHASLSPPSQTNNNQESNNTAVSLEKANNGISTIHSNHTHSSTQKSIHRHPPIQKYTIPTAHAQKKIPIQSQHTSYNTQKNRTTHTHTDQNILKTTVSSLRQIPTTTQYITPTHKIRQIITARSSISLHTDKDRVKFRLDEIKAKLSRISNKVNTYVTHRFTSANKRKKLLGNTTQESNILL